MESQFHLSVVATARNDNHGQNFLYRMQHFVDGFIEQCKRHQLKAELIIVEWNPPEENEPLYKALKFPEDKGPCAVRFIRVPQEAHMKLAHSDKLPLFQMIAKNVGIRRALGSFVLATNIDILFSDKLIRFLRDKLKPKTLYRVDRLDVPSELPSTSSLDQILAFCKKTYFRINGKYGTKVKINGKWQKRKRKIVLPSCTFRKDLITMLYPLTLRRLIKASKIIPPFLLKRLTIRTKITILFAKKVIKKFKLNFLHKVHSNACGDFTLLSYEDWKKLRAYPEWEMYSWHIDSVFLYQAQHAAIKEVDLPRKMAIYHIEHSVGSGYTHEASNALFKRLQDKGIPYLNDLALRKFAGQGKKNAPLTLHNTESWGMADLTLEEIWM